MIHRFDGPIRLDEGRWNTAELVRLSGATEKAIENWQQRRILALGGHLPDGRRVYSLLDAIRVAAVSDLTRRTGMGPRDAVDAAELLSRYVAEHAPQDSAGQPTADFNAIPRTLAYALAAVDGVMCVGLVDPSRPGYADPAGPYGRAHVVLPIAGLVAGVLARLLELVHAQVPESAS